MGGRFGRIAGAASALALALGLLGVQSVGAVGGAPGAPPGLTATSGPDIGQVRLTWTAPTDVGSGISTYQIGRAHV